MPRDGAAARAGRRHSPAVPPPTPPRHIVFVHVPKTAGTSLRFALAAVAGGRTVLLDYGDVPQTTPSLRGIARDPARAADLATAHPQGVLLMGHFPARRYWGVFPPESFITFVREPVARVLSDWNHHVTVNHIAQDLPTFARRPGMRNRMTQMLGGLWPSFGFVGVTERYAEDLARLSAFLGVTVAEERRNLGFYGDDLPGRRIGPEVLAEVAALNAADAGLYGRVLAARVG